MPPFTVKVAVPAVAVSVNCVSPPVAPLRVPLFVMTVALPAVDVPVNAVSPPTPDPPPNAARWLVITAFPAVAVW